MVDAVGLFKSENKTPFIKVVRNGNSYGLIQENGINIEKLDKGCLVFNLMREEGYVVSVIDNTNKGEAKYWKDDFLRLKRKNDEYTQTQNTINLCKGFILQLPDEISRAEKASMMNKVVDSLNEGNVQLSSLAASIFGTDSVNTFKEYVRDYQETNDVVLNETFNAVPNVVKRRTLARITTLKLDSNFDVKIYGGGDYIESGFDSQKKMKYYKLFYYNEH